MQYKINQAIIVRYLAIDNEESLTDLTLTPTNPSGVDQTPILFSEIGDGLYTANFTPNATGWWLVRVSSVSKPKNVYSKSYFVGTEYTTYPPQEDGKLTSINAKLGEVQVTPTQYSLLGRLKDLWDKLNDLFTTGLAKVKLWDGTEVANVTTDNKLETITHGRGRCSTLNSTLTALGAGETFTGTWEEVLDYSMLCILILSDQDSAIDGLVIEWSCDGIYVEQVDSFNIKSNIGKTFTFGMLGKYFRVRYTNGGVAQTLFRLQALLKPFNQKASSHRITDAIVAEDDAELVKAVLTGQTNSEFVNVKVTSDGRLQVEIIPSSIYTTLQLTIDRFLTAINNYEWQEILEYEVPTGYDFNCVSFEASSDVANEAARAIHKELLGSFVCNTNTFTDGTIETLPNFLTKMYIYVTTAIGSGNNDVITITYTNQDGVTGRTGTVTIPKSSLVGTRLEVIMQEGDYGIIDVTDVTHSATGQAGTFNIEGIMGLFYQIINATKTQYQASAVSLGGIVITQGRKIYLQYLANSAVSNKRRISLVGTLIPR